MALLSPGPLNSLVAIKHRFLTSFIEHREKDQPNTRKMHHPGGFPGGPAIKNPLPVQGRECQILIWEDAAEQLSPCARTVEEPAPRGPALQQATRNEAHALQ